MPSYWSPLIHGDKETVDACRAAVAEYHAEQEALRARRQAKEDALRAEIASLTDDDKKALVAKLQVEYDAQKPSSGVTQVDTCLGWAIYYLYEKNGHRPISLWLDSILSDKYTRRRALESLGFQF